MKKLNSEMFHDFKSFFKDGLKERTTWIAFGSGIFGLIFYKDIYHLIHNYLSNSRTIDLLITSSPAIITFLLAWIKEK